MNREELAEVVRKEALNVAATDVPIAVCQVMVSAVLQHLASQRQEQECGPVEKCPVCRHNTVHVGCVTATLEASRALAASAAKVEELEAKLKRYETPEYHVRHNCCTAVEASERALERAKAFVNLKIAHRGDCVFVRQDFTGAECTCGKQADALASPEAPHHP